MDKDNIQMVVVKVKVAYFVKLIKMGLLSFLIIMATYYQHLLLAISFIQVQVKLTIVTFKFILVGK